MSPPEEADDVTARSFLARPIIGMISGNRISLLRARCAAASGSARPPTQGCESTRAWPLRGCRVMALDGIESRLGTAHAGWPRLFTSSNLVTALEVATALSHIKRAIPVEAVFTFDGPHPGDVTFAAYCKGTLGRRTRRLVYGDETESTVASSALIYGHVGKLMRCLHDERFADRPPAIVNYPDELLFADGMRQDSLEAITVLICRISSLLQQFGPAVRILWRRVWRCTRRCDRHAIRASAPRLLDHIPDRY